jgi:hypothetical protein
MRWWLFACLTAGAAIWCLAIYGAWVMFNPPKCELGIGALL